MVAEFGIDSGWLDHPAVLEKLWIIASARWANRAKAIEGDQRDDMRARLKAMTG
jgi:hypothetical protein